MRGLIYKDLYNLKKYMRQLVFIIAAMAVMCLFFMARLNAGTTAIHERRMAALESLRPTSEAAVIDAQRTGRPSGRGGIWA